MCFCFLSGLRSSGLHHPAERGLGGGPAKPVPATMEGCLLWGALPAPSLTGSREAGKQLRLPHVTGVHSLQSSGAFSLCHAKLEKAGKELCCHPLPQIPTSWGLFFAFMHCLPAGELGGGCGQTELSGGSGCPTTSSEPRKAQGITGGVSRHQ